MLNGVYAIDNGLIAVSGTQTGTFVNKNVGTSKAVSVGGLNLQGASSGNYVLANTVLTANITPAQLSVSGFSATNKVYDGTTNDQILGQGSLSGILPIDAGAVSLTGSVSGTFANANAGTAKVVSLSGLSLTGASADLAGLDEFAAHWRWRRAHPQATVVGRFREDGATGVATAQGIQCVPIRAESYAIWRAEIVRLALFAAPNLDDYATHAIACCMAARERSPVSSS